MGVAMQSVRQPAARSSRVPATNATLVWFSDEAVKRRRRATAAGEGALSPSTATASGSIGLGTSSYAEIHRPAQAHRAAYLRTLFRRILAGVATLSKPAPSETTVARPIANSNRR